MAYANAPVDPDAVQGAFPKVLVGSNKVFAHPLPFNLIPHIDAFQVSLMQSCYFALSMKRLGYES